MITTDCTIKEYICVNNAGTAFITTNDTLATINSNCFHNGGYGIQLWEHKRNCIDNQNTYSASASAQVTLSGTMSAQTYFTPALNNAFHASVISIILMLALIIFVLYWRLGGSIFGK
jgi:hypothetical protein